MSDYMKTKRDIILDTTLLWELFKKIESECEFGGFETDRDQAQAITHLVTAQILLKKDIQPWRSLGPER